MLRDNDVLRQYSTDITIDNDGGHGEIFILAGEGLKGRNEVRQYPFILLLVAAGHF